EFAGKKRVLVRNKVDLPVKLSYPAEVQGATIDVCCLTGQGIEQLKTQVKDLVWSGEIKAEMLQAMINSRHQEALTRSCAATQRAIEALRDDQTLELVAM